MRLTASTRLGPYEIVGPLGAGGMGEVYKAQDTRLGRVVAIKILPEAVAEREDLRQRFEREARTASALNHPHICSIFDVGSEGDVHFLVMEYLDGEPMDKRLERGPMALDEAIRTAVQVAGALDQAHRAGVVHRDLKPANIMLTRTGAKLLDFGLAKVREAGGTVAAATAFTSLPTQTQALTTEGTILGTFQYMAPEQLEGAEADARSDIFSFGAVLYEMVTGRKAFTGKSNASLISAIMATEPPPVSSVQPLAPPALERVIRRCLAKEADERWQSARDLAKELQWIAESGSQSGVPAVVAARRRGRERTAWIGAGAAALLLAGSLGLNVRHLTEAPPPALPVRFNVEKPDGTQFSLPSAPVLSPDGQQMAFAVMNGNTSAIYLRPLSSLDARRLAGTEGGYTPVFSPDGRSIAFVTSNGALKRLDLVGGGAQTLANGVPGGLSPRAWGRDGTILGAGWSGPIQAVPASGGTSRAVTTVDEKGGERGHLWPGFLPDGRHFLYTAVEPTRQRFTVFAGSLDDPKLKKLILVASGVAQYTEPGYLVYSADENLVAQPFDPRQLTVRGEATPVAEQVYGTNGAPGMGFSAANGILAWRSGTSNRISQLTWFDRSGKRLETVWESGELANPVLSPDGKRVLVTVRDPALKTRDIWVYDLTRNVATKVTFDPAEDFNPVWSPDGVYFAFSSNRKGAKNIYRKRGDGIGAEEELLVSPEDKNVEQWTPDGKYIVYNQAVGGRPADLYLLPLEGDRKPVPFATSRFYEADGAVSPDGRWIAYRSNESGTPQVYVQPVPGRGGQGKWQVSTRGGMTPQWRADGKELFYFSQAKIVAVAVNTAGETFEAGNPVELFDFQLGPSLRNHFTVSADGRRFLVATPPEGNQAQRFHVLLNFPSALKR